MSYTHSQELFDRIASHLLAQGEMSSNKEGDCLYRAGELRCAIGCLIDDAHYYKNLEGKNFNHPLVLQALEGSLGFLLGDDELDLLRQAQDVHDAWPSTMWSDTLTNLAKRNGLSTSTAFSS